MIGAWVARGLDWLSARLVSDLNDIDFDDDYDGYLT